MSETRENSDYSVTDSDEDIDGFHGSNEASSSSDTMDTLEEYGFPGDKGASEKYLFEDDYAPQGTPNPLRDHSSTDGHDGNKSDYSNPEHATIEMPQIGGKAHKSSGSKSFKKSKKKESRKHIRQKSKHKLQGKSNSKKKKKKKKKFNKWQTIVFASSPTEDSAMLFEEGPAVVDPPAQKRTSGERIMRSGVGTRDASAKRGRRGNRSKNAGNIPNGSRRGNSGQSQSQSQSGRRGNGRQQRGGQSKAKDGKKLSFPKFNPFQGSSSGTSQAPSGQQSGNVYMQGSGGGRTYRNDGRGPRGGPR